MRRFRPGDLLLLEQSVGTKDEKGTVVAIDDKGKRDFEVSAESMRGKVKTAKSTPLCKSC